MRPTLTQRHLATAVHAFHGRGSRASHAPLAAIIIGVAISDATEQANLLVFNANGTTELLTHVMHEGAWKAKAATEPTWDADAHPFFRWTDTTQIFNEVEK